MQLRLAAGALALLVPSLASAAEVVWLTPAKDPQMASTVVDRAGGTRKNLGPDDLRAAATDWSPADVAAYQNLDGALREVRQYETRLDGELLIMDGLAGPISKIGIVRNDTDRAALFSALAYQGFAVDRFFDQDLSKDDRAKPYRVELNGLVVELPWADAVALDPAREVTPYDIAEAPQRVAYGKVAQVVKQGLPALLEPKDVPADAKVVVDGRPATPGPTGTITLVPGRHLVHVERGGHVVARYDLRLAPGAKQSIAVPLTDATWDAFVAGVKSGSPTTVPAEVAADVAALGGEVWLVDPAGPKGRPAGWKVTASGVTALDAAQLEAPTSGDADQHTAMVARVVVGGGWLSTGDFYNQDPANVPDTRGAVNAGAVGLGGSLDRQMGMFDLGAGVDAVGTLGPYHVALYGDHETRVRTYPYLAFGAKYAQATVGYVFPHHPTAGLRATIPLASGLELRAAAWYGLAMDRQRADGTVWEGLPLYSAWGGVGWRFGG